MTMNRLAIIGGVLTIFVGSSHFGTIGAQSGGAVSERIWENDRMQLVRLSLAPGERFTDESREGSAIIFMTTDLDGRMPPAEAAWHDPGPVMLENRGRTRFEAVVVDLKTTLPRSIGVTAPEVVRAREPGASQVHGVEYGAGEARAEGVIFNDRMSVTKERYGIGQSWSSDPPHFHPQDVVVVYLRGGYVWPTAGTHAPQRVRRGDVRIVPANVLHTPANAGSDPLEFLLIIPA